MKKHALTECVKEEDQDDHINFLVNSAMDVTDIDQNECVDRRDFQEMTKKETVPGHVSSRRRQSTGLKEDTRGQDHIPGQTGVQV